jgi:hypothetical protein
MGDAPRPCNIGNCRWPAIDDESTGYVFPGPLPDRPLTRFFAGAFFSLLLKRERRTAV